MMNDIVAKFRGLRLALRKDEVWRNVDFSDMVGEDYAPIAEQEPIEMNCHCNIPNLTAEKIQLENGFCHHTMQRWDNGVLIGGLRDAMKECPELVEKVLGRCIGKKNPYETCNAEHFTDGVFVYVPDNTVVDKAIQIQSVVAAKKPGFVQVRNVVFVGRHSQAKLIHCDDSMDDSRSFSNNVTEIFLDEDTHAEYYKLENMNDASGLLNHTYLRLGANSVLRSIAVTLNGGSIRNHCEIRMDGENCDVQAHGLYLIDKSQQADNYIFVEHSHPHCNSTELFKGIVDDSAKATFNGHVLVDYGAAKTEAYQSNKNILLNDKALVNTKPFLEIYNDDVKCSHGSTIGQLDEQALFYIRSRGISERTAKTLLLYAFCDEVIQKIEIPELRESLSDMVKKRLHGELTPCADCALHCNTPCNGPEAHFAIDPSKF